MSDSKSFDNGCHIKTGPYAKTPSSKPSGEKTKKECEKLDKKFDGGDGPNEGSVVGSESK